MRKSCETCKHDAPVASEQCKGCERIRTMASGEPWSAPSHWEAKSMTNADRIRAMTDEELARALATECIDRESCYGCFAYKDNGECPAESISEWIKWLQQPAEGA